MNDKDKLERFILENREAFNNDEPGGGLWGHISKELDKETSKTRPFLHGIYWKAAAVVFFGLCTFLLIERALQKPDNELLATQPTSVSEANLNAEFIKVENYYSALIEEKKMQLASYEVGKEGLGEEFTQDIHKLDALYLKLKVELNDNKNNGKVIEAMIQNLQVRIEILNQQLIILEKVQQVKNSKNDETHTI